MLQNKVRIIGGSLRNSRLGVADVEGLRPTAERIRETLFNWLAPSVAGAIVLDWFAGTGALGIEAISRGAARVDFVEANPQVARMLQDNVMRLKIAGQTKIQSGSAPQTLPLGPFDLVLLDPPFALNLWSECLHTLQLKQVMKPTALIYLEAPSTYALPPILKTIKQARAGAVQFGLYQLVN
jgi:16S rRNA (guanine966-N2)-methyltransferase